MLEKLEQLLGVAFDMPFEAALMHCQMLLTSSKFSELLYSLKDGVDKVPNIILGLELFY